MSARQIAPKCGYPDLGDSRQGDFHEFYNFIIDSIHEATAIEDPYLKKINNTAILPADIRDKSPMQIITQLANAEWAKVFHHKWSPIVKSTYGQIVNVVECQTCRFSSIKCDILCHLSLQLDTRKPVMSIADALIEYTKDEILDGSEAWYCERCKEKRRAIRKLVPWKLPEYLMIVFKRFDPLTDAKINTIVEFNIDNLDLKQWAPGPGRETCVYEAAAIANHVGGRHGGHYFTFIRNQNGNWYVMDDDSISIIPPPTSRLIGPQNYGFLMRKKRT
jgi:ubiquitin C-terminal hydrolase